MKSLRLALYLALTLLLPAASLAGEILLHAKPVPSPSTIAAGHSDSFAIDREGTPYGWGDNSYGKLGIPK